MANLNKVFLMGNLTRDPQLSYLPSQTAVCEISIATNRRWTSADGQQKEEVTFVDCSCFGKRGEVIGKYFKKGKPIYVEGRLKLDQWEAQDGTKRSKMRVIIEDFQFIDGGNRGGDAGNAPDEDASAQQPRPAARQPFRPAARPSAMPARAAAEDFEPPSPEDDAPPIKDEDIPF